MEKMKKMLTKELLLQWEVAEEAWAEYLSCRKLTKHGQSPSIISFFGQFILDCLHRTENAMTQAHAFKAAELCLLAQAAAVRC